MLDDILLQYIVWIWTSEFHSTRTVGNEATWLSHVKHMGSANTMDHIILSIIER